VTHSFFVGYVCLLACFQYCEPNIIGSDFIFFIFGVQILLRRVRRELYLNLNS